MKTFLLKDRNQIIIDFDKGTIQAIIFANENIIRGETPFFSVKLRDGIGKTRIITAFDCVFQSFDGKCARYSHKDVEICVFITQKDDGLLWRLNVRNKTADLLEWVELASFGVADKLQDEEDGVGAIVYPYNEGALVTDMNKRMSSPFTYIEPEYPSLGKYSIFPNMISSQFLSYIANKHGVYLGLHDKERTTKHIDFRYGHGCIKLQMRTYCNVNYAEDYVMSFDCDMTLFEGDYFDACALYRQWFENYLPEGVKKTVEANDLPSWYGESPIVVAYPIRGKFDTDEMKPNGLYPYKNALPFLREIAEKTESRVMSLLMHWEGTAPWAPPYVWPPYGGENEFSEYLQEAHSSGILVGLYCSGMGWTQRSNLVPDYSMEMMFAEEGLADIMCSDTDGSLHSKICKEQRFGYDVCPACERSKAMFVKEFNRLVKSGVDYVQALDQNHGGGSYFCYSKKHNHIPAPGKWQAEETVAMLSRIDNGRVLLGCESAAAEPFLANLKFSDNRFNLNYYIGIPIPIYSFIYHEYVNNFMGNQICMMLSKEEYNYSFRCAYSFIAGDMLTAVIDDKGQIAYCWGSECFKAHTEKTSALKVLRNLNSWRQNGGKKFLHTGRMVKPLPVACGEKSFILENGSRLQVPEVLTAAYEFEGERAQFIANYNLTPVTIKLPQKVTVYMDSLLESCLKDVDVLEIPALSAVMIQYKE